MTTAILSIVLVLVFAVAALVGLGGVVGQVELAILCLGVAVAITLVVRRARMRAAGRKRTTSA